MEALVLLHSLALHNKSCYCSVFGSVPKVSVTALRESCNFLTGKVRGFILEASEAKNPPERTNSGHTRTLNCWDPVPGGCPREPAAPRAGQRAEAPQAAGTRASLRPLRRSTNNYQAPSTCHTVKQDRQDPGLKKLPCRLEEPGDHKEIKE